MYRILTFLEVAKPLQIKIGDKKTGDRPVATGALAGLPVVADHQERRRGSKPSHPVLFFAVSFRFCWCLIALVNGFIFCFFNDRLFSMLVIGRF